MRAFYMLVLFLLAILVVQATRVAFAHEWYPWECCSDNDCAPLALEQIPREENGGFTLTDGRHVAYKDVRPSPDGKFHLCEQKWEPNPRDRKILCFYAPVGGS